ncbi:MAG TPA: flagellar export protein FliJ [Pirellulaceae bacterium]|nr:flagellar export protein FliJ [Pirellulaceae bacterium]
MPPFRFRLETLLRLRIGERDERRADLAKALRAEAMLRDERERIGIEQIEIQTAIRQRSAPGSADVDALLRVSRYQAVLKARDQQLEQQLTQVIAEVERRRLVLAEADRQVRVLEKLRERQFADHRQRANRLEIKELDEVAATGHLRRAEVRA